MDFADEEELGVEPGQIIADKYRLEKLLGRGGMGSVWHAEHLTLASPVALKILRPRISKNKNSMGRFLREAKAAAMLRSPHVVQILDHGSDGPIAYIAMEMLEGESLYDCLEREKKLGFHLTATIATHVGRAIGRAHQTGIIHRDLKPDNVFLIPNEDEVIAKVLDFGIAKSALDPLNVTGSPQTATGALLGTPYYMSPEQTTGSKDVDHRADLWALAVIVFECICGRRPFQSTSLGDLVLQICSRPIPKPSDLVQTPPAFDAWFARATQRKPDDRFQTARELTAELRAALIGPEARTSLSAQDEPERDEPAPDSVPDAAELAPSELDWELPTGSDQTVDSTSAETKAAGDQKSANRPADALVPTVDSSEKDRPKTDDPTASTPQPASGPHAPGAELMPSSTLASAGVDGATLEPLSTTAQPGRRKVVFGAAAVVLVAAAAGGFALSRNTASAVSPTTASSAIGNSPSPPPATAATSAATRPTPSATSSSSASDSDTSTRSHSDTSTHSATMTKTAKTTVTVPRPTKPRGTTTAKPTNTPTDDDPLGIPVR